MAHLLYCIWSFTVQDLECDVINGQGNDDSADGQTQDSTPDNIPSEDVHTQTDTSADGQSCPAKKDGFISSEKLRINNVRGFITTGFILGFIPLAW